MFAGIVHYQPLVVTALGPEHMHPVDALGLRRTTGRCTWGTVSSNGLCVPVLTYYTLALAKHLAAHLPDHFFVYPYGSVPCAYVSLCCWCTTV